MRTLKANLQNIDRNPVDPARWSTKNNPVTLEELGGDFRVSVQLNADPRKPKTAGLYFDHYDLGDVVRPNIEIIMAGDRIADLGKDTPEAEHCRALVKDLVRRKLYIQNLWGFLPYCRNAEGMPEPIIPEATHKWLMANAGKSFGGYEVGEQEGRYLGNHAQRIRSKTETETDYEYYCDQADTFRKKEAAFEKHRLKSFFRNPAEAHRDFRRWMNLFENGLHRCLSPIAHTNWMHYLCELDGARMLGAELALIMMNHQVTFAFMRGASRQYGLLTYALPSVWTRWGFSYPAADGRKSTTTAGGTETGLGKGLSTNLARRIWYLGYMYGLNIFGIEAGYFSRPESDYIDGKTTEVPPLSSLGKLQVSAKKWCLAHPGRGVQYNPVGLVLGFDNGWLAPKYGYQFTGERRLTWNTLPYRKGDHQIDNFFRWVFPGYEESSYHRDERATFVPTPFGDIFDVLLENADPRILARYKSLVLLGDCRISGPLLSKLRKYVRAGGDLIISAENIAEDAADFYGLKSLGRNRMDNITVRGKKRFSEKWFGYRQVEPTGADVILKSGAGDPLITANKYGQGRVIVVCADFWMNERRGSLEERTGLASQRVADRDLKRVFAGRSEFFEERNWECPYNSPIKKMILDGENLAAIEAKICSHCRVECTNDVSKQCDLLEGVKDVFGEYLKSFMPVEIEGPPVHYLVNLTKDRKKIIVTLANHSGSPWTGNIRFKKPGIKIRNAKEWMKDEPTGLLRIQIPPRDLKILEISADQDIL